jgi:hypothetical protein
VSDVILCEFCNGIPVVQGVRTGYYHCDHLGQRRLILTRKEHESLRISDVAEIVVLAITRDETQLGIIWK